MYGQYLRDMPRHDRCCGKMGMVEKGGSEIIVN